MAVFPDEKVPSIKKEFPRLHSNLKLFWGSRDFNEFIDNLVMNKGDRIDRQGFPHHIIKELFNLQRTHKDLFPQWVRVDKWDI